MTYRNKLLLRRLLLVLAVLAASAFAVYMIFFIYLGRYVVYTEDGAYLSILSRSGEEAPVTTLPVPQSVELVTGDPIATEELMGETVATLEDAEVQGYLIDYAQLSDGTALSQMDLNAQEINTLVLQMRAPDKNLLTTEPVKALIERAKSLNIHLVAMISCLSDSQYAQANPDQGLKSDFYTLWITNDGTNWLDPGQDAVIEYLAGIIRELADMGFQEVVLDDFYMPNSDLYDYVYDGRTNADVTTEAFQKLQNATMDQCKLGLMVWDPNLGHQALEASERLYVCFSNGSSLKSYVEDHEEQYLVFVTDSHDTRFQNYGMIRADSDFISRGGAAESSRDTEEETTEEEATEEE